MDIEQIPYQIGAAFGEFIGSGVLVAFISFAIKKASRERWNSMALRILAYFLVPVFALLVHPDGPEGSIPFFLMATILFAISELRKSDNEERSTKDAKSIQKTVDKVEEREKKSTSRIMKSLILFVSVVCITGLAVAASYARGESHASNETANGVTTDVDPIKKKSETEAPSEENREKVSDLSNAAIQDIQADAPMYPKQVDKNAINEELLEIQRQQLEEIKKQNALKMKEQADAFLQQQLDITNRAIETIKLPQLPDVPLVAPIEVPEVTVPESIHAEPVTMPDLTNPYRQPGSELDPIYVQIVP